MSNGIVYHNQLLITLVTKWSPFGHWALGHRFSQASLSIDKLIFDAIGESQLTLMG